MKKLVLLTIFISTLFASGFDSEDGAPIRQGVHIEWYRTVAPGNNGEAIFVWSDTRYGMRNIFAHKISQAGEMLWGEAGAVVTDLPGRQEDPVAIADGNGGVFIGWVDYRFDAQGDIFIQHLDSDGNLLLDENGIALAQVEGKQITINMCTDSLGGVFVTWQDKRGGVDEDIYGTHISANHEIVAQGTGLAIAVEGGNQNAKTIEYAGNNQAFIAWADYREGENANIYGQRLNMDMTTVFAENGIPIANTNEQETKPRATFVNGETSFVTWKRGDTDSKVFYQFVNENGLVFSEEKAISDDETLQAKPRVKRNSNGEIFIKWTDYRDDTEDGDQYFQKVDTNGDRVWGNGVRIDPDSSRDFSARFGADEIGGLNVAWERGTFPDIEIVFRHINTDGTFSNDPFNVSNADGYQFSPNLVGSNGGEFYIIYADQGSGSIDLKVQKVDDEIPVWENGGITAMVGLDGDVKYTNSFREGENDFFLTWEDNRSSKRIYGTRITDSVIQFEEGEQLSFSDNSSEENTLPIVAKDENNFYVGTYDATSSPKFLRINKLTEQMENVWDSNGVAIASQADMRDAQIIPLGDGVGCFWSESRLWDNNVYYQKLDAEGSTTLESNGVELVDASNDDFFLKVVPAPDDKLFIFWINVQWNPSGSYEVIKYLKIDQDGSAEIGWNPAGFSLTDNYSASSKLQVYALEDGSGLICFWSQIGNNADIYAQKLDWDGNKQWNTNGIIISDEQNDQTNFSFAFNETNTKSLIVWEDFRNGQNFEIFGQVLNVENGALSGDHIQFTSVVNDSLHNYMPVVENVVANEFMVIWEDGRGYINEDPLLINGVDLYGSGYKIGQGMTTDLNGIPICVAYHKQQNVNITHHSGQEFFLDWVDYRSSGKEDLANYYGRTIMKADLLSNDPQCYNCDVPTEFSLKPAYPNPFNGKVTFEFEMPAKEAVEFRIYDITGRVVADKLILPGFGGKYKINWDGLNRSGQIVPSGIYFYEFKTTNTIKKGKVTYLK
jgi:hypothetical protein